MTNPELQNQLVKFKSAYLESRTHIWDVFGLHALKFFDSLGCKTLQQDVLVVSASGHLGHRQTLNPQP